jgi:DNA polymerase III delta prime subunit
VIDEVHMLSSSAFNAFLKTLEEPPPYAIFILATTENIKSCQQFLAVARSSILNVSIQLILLNTWKKSARKKTSKQIKHHYR